MGAFRRWALAGFIEVGPFALFYIFPVGTFVTVVARKRDFVDVLSERTGMKSAPPGGEQGFSPFIIPDLVPVVFDVVIEDGAGHVVEVDVTLAFLAVLERRPVSGAMLHLDVAFSRVVVVQVKCVDSSDAESGSEHDSEHGVVEAGVLEFCEVFQYLLCAFRLDFGVPNVFIPVKLRDTDFLAEALRYGVVVLGPPEERSERRHLSVKGDIVEVPVALSPMAVLLKVATVEVVEVFNLGFALAPPDEMLESVAVGLHGLFLAVALFVFEVVGERFFRLDGDEFEFVVRHGYL